MTEIPGRGSQEQQPIETREGVDRMLNSAYRNIQHHLLQGGIIEPSTKKGTFTTKPFGERQGLPFPLNQTNPMVDFSREDHFDAKLSWEEKDGTTRRIELAIGDGKNPMYMLTTERKDHEDEGYIREGAISYHDGEVSLDQTRPISYIPAIQLDELRNEGNKEVDEGWQDAKGVLHTVEQGLGALKPLG